MADEDIVRRLRRMVKKSYLLHMGRHWTANVRDAADAIEDLRELVASLEADLDARTQEGD